MNIKNQVFEYIREHPGCSYVELERFFDGIGFEWRGDIAFVHEQYEKVIFWTNWNQEAFGILCELEAEKRIVKKPAPPWLYLIDGKGLPYPVIRSMPDCKAEHWLPVVYSVIETSINDLASGPDKISRRRAFR
ncbi:MAG: pathogenicity island protein [Bacillota bacterium]